LEERTLLAHDTLSSAVLLNLGPSVPVHVSSSLTDPNQVQLYKIALDVGDEIIVNVSDQAIGSSLQSVVRIFDQAGNQVAVDEPGSGNLTMIFQAATTGNYFVGVSSAGDDNYSPTKSANGSNGSTEGSYALDLRLTPDVPLQAHVTLAAFQLQADTVQWGQTLSGAFTVENSGGAAASAISVTLALSNSASYDSSTTQVLPAVLQTAAPATLEAGQAWSASFSVSLPSAPPPTFADSGSVYLGLVIDPSNGLSSSGPFTLWKSLTVVTPPAVTSPDSAPADADTTTDTLTTNPFDSEPFATLYLPGNGSAAGNGGTFGPLMTLSWMNGAIQADSGETGSGRSTPAGSGSGGGGLLALEPWPSDALLTQLSLPRDHAGAPRSDGGGAFSSKIFAFPLLSSGLMPASGSSSILALDGALTQSTACSTAPAGAPLVLVVTLVADPLPLRHGPAQNAECRSDDQAADPKGAAAVSSHSNGEAGLQPADRVLGPAVDGLLRAVELSKPTREDRGSRTEDRGGQPAILDPNVPLLDSTQQGAEALLGVLAGVLVWCEGRQKEKGKRPSDPPSLPPFSSSPFHEGES
jgi:hypothetical protein